MRTFAKQAQRKPGEETCPPPEAGNASSALVLRNPDHFLETHLQHTCVQDIETRSAAAS
jgi:hypothetical protein